MRTRQILTPAFLKAVPDQPDAAFVSYLERGFEYLDEVQAEFSRSEDNNWNDVLKARASVIGVIIKAAQQYEIEPFSSMDAIDPMQESEFQEFERECERYLASFHIRKVAESRRAAVRIDPDLKKRIRSQINKLKGLIESSDLPPRRKAKLNRKLAEVEAELDSERVNLHVVAGLIILGLGVSADLTAIGESNWIKGPLDALLQLVGDAESASDKANAGAEERLLLPSPMQAKITDQSGF